MDRGAWRAPTVDSVTKSQTRPSDLAHMQPVPLARAAGEAATGMVAGSESLPLIPSCLCFSCFIPGFVPKAQVPTLYHRLRGCVQARQSQRRPNPLPCTIYPPWACWGLLARSVSQ